MELSRCRALLIFFALTALPIAGFGQSGKVTFLNELPSGAITVWLIQTADGRDLLQKVGEIQAKNKTVVNKLSIDVNVGETCQFREGPDKVLRAERILPQRIQTGDYLFTSGIENWSLEHNGKTVPLALAGTDDNYFYLWDFLPDSSDRLDLEVTEYRFPIKSGVAQKRTRGGGQRWADLGAADYHMDGKVIRVQHLDLPLRVNRPRLRRLPNVDPTLFSFDLSLIDPIRDIKRGRKLQLFENLQETDTDYDVADGDYVVKRGLVFDTLNSGFGSNYAETIVDSTKLSETWGLSIKQSVGVKKGKEKLGSASRSASYKNIANDLKSKKAFYSIAREMRYKYSLTPNPLIILLTKNFVDEVSSLSISQPGDYDEFVKRWGTHYVTSMNYGGAKYVTIRFDQQTAKSLRGFEWNASLEAKANIKGVEVGSSVSGSYKRSKEVASLVSSKMKKFHYLGGEGNWDSFTVGDDVEPIEIAVAPLSDLLVPAVFFKDQISG